MSRKEQLEKEFALLTPMEFDFFTKNLNFEESGDAIYHQVLNDLKYNKYKFSGNNQLYYKYYQEETERTKEWSKDIPWTWVNGNAACSNSAFRMIIGIARERKWLRDQLEEVARKYTALEEKNKVYEQESISVTQKKMEVEKQLEELKRDRLSLDEKTLALAQSLRSHSDLEQSLRVQQLALEDDRRTLSHKLQDYDQELQFLRSNTHSFLTGSK